MQVPETNGVINHLQDRTEERHNESRSRQALGCTPYPKLFYDDVADNQTENNRQKGIEREKRSNSSYLQHVFRGEEESDDEVVRSGGGGVGVRLLRKGAKMNTKIGAKGFAS